jgi:hypothetical protein
MKVCACVVCCEGTRDNCGRCEHNLLTFGDGGGCRGSLDRCTQNVAWVPIYQSYASSSSHFYRFLWIGSFVWCVRLTGQHFLPFGSSLVGYYYLYFEYKFYNDWHF